MGTRASFWIGNPTDIKNREWLGCVAFDGYPDGIDGIETVKTEGDFRLLVAEQSKRRDFAHPSKGWPYPWDGDIFLTDYTYAFFDGRLQLTPFHRGFMSLEEHQKQVESEEEEEDGKDTLPGNIPAPEPYSPNQPDSIIIVSGI